MKSSHVMRPQGLMFGRAGLPFSKKWSQATKPKEGAPSLVAQSQTLFRCQFPDTAGNC